jgi:NADH dehydrogenase FAD-containing subunit
MRTKLLHYLLLSCCVAEDGLRFFVEYDHLAISTGSQGSTFGIPGVEQYTHFLRYASTQQHPATAVVTFLL